MKVRDKLLLAMAVLIVFMGSVYFGFTSLFTRHLFHRYAFMIKRTNAEQLALQLAFYYQTHQSWDGVERYVETVYFRKKMKLGLQQNITLYDAGHHVLVSVGTLVEEEKISIPVWADGKQVALLEVSSKGPAALDEVEQNVLHSMTVGTFSGVIVTSLAALLVGGWLTRRIVSPLHSMIQTMQKIKDGDLEARLSITTRDEFGKVGETFNLMTDRLLRTEQARSRLVADVAHELRTPLTIIQGQLELIQQGVKPAEPATMLPIQDEVSRLAKLVQDLHQLSLAEVGQLPLEKVPTDLVKLLSNLVKMYEVEAEERQIRMELVNGIGNEVPLIMVDPHRIAQVFVNLITNALRYTPPGGNVTVRVDKPDSHLSVSVSDTGKGIPEQHLPYVFNRFYRADETRSRDMGGTGLGLAIAKEFVEAHGGEIHVTSRRGTGTTFTVRLPAR